LASSVVGAATIIPSTDSVGRISRVKMCGMTTMSHHNFK
jgi:hypothetical protein